MNSFGNTLSLIIIFTSVRKILLQPCKSGQIAAPKYGKMLEGHVLNKITSIGSKQCAEKCYIRSDCLSFNYNVEGNSCELNSANETDVPLTINEDYVYADRSNIQPSLAGSCSGITCPSGYKCISLHNGQAKCMSIQNDKPVPENCRNTLQGLEYTGTTNITAMGIPCQNWSSNTPHDSGYKWLSAGNHCRNPSGERYGPWCYTTDPNPDARWQYCDIPFCIINKQKECKTTTLGYEYFGKANTTITGKMCQAWVLNTPHTHPNHEFPGNECRNPDAAPNGPWCFTTDSSTRWEYCDIPFC